MSRIKTHLLSGNRFHEQWERVYHYRARRPQVFRVFVRLERTVLPGTQEGFAMSLLRSGAVAFLASSTRSASITRTTTAAALLLICTLAAAPAHAGIRRVQPVFARDAVTPVRPTLEGTACDTLWADSILYRLELPSTVFTFGDTVRMVYRITNHRSTQAVFTFASTCQEWFGVYPDSCGPGQAGCESTWHSGWSCYYTQTRLEIEAGESAEYVLDWRQHTDEGYPAPPGAYTAYGTLKITELFYPLLLSVPFTIVPYGPRPIQEALDAATAGDTVLVGAGIYYENLVLMDQHAGVVLKSDDGPQTTFLDGGRRGSVVYAYYTLSTTVIEGFTIRGGRNAASREYYGSYTPGGGVALLQSAHPDIRNNIIRDNESTRGGGIAVNYASDVHIEGNLFLDNTATDAGGGAYVSPPSYGTGPFILRCTFAGNHAPKGGGVFQSSGSSSRVSNCIFYRNVAEVAGGGLHCPFFGVPQNVCNDFWENVPDDMFDCDNAVNPIFANPRFCAPDTDDYALQDSSPCAPLMNPTCGQVGAYGVGCSTADTGYDASSGLTRMSVAPNPAPGDVRVLLPAAWRGSAPGSTRTIEIRSITGKKIWSSRVGSEALVWNGRDANGRPAPSGIYLVVAREGGKILSTVTLVRIE